MPLSPSYQPSCVHSVHGAAAPNRDSSSAADASSLEICRSTDVYSGESYVKPPGASKPRVTEKLLLVATGTMRPLLLARLLSERGMPLMKNVPDSESSMPAIMSFSAGIDVFCRGEVAPDTTAVRAIRPAYSSAMPSIPLDADAHGNTM